MNCTCTCMYAYSVHTVCTLNWYICVCSVSSIISGPFMCVCVCMYTQKQARKEAVLIQAPTVEEDDDDNGYSLSYVQDGMLSGQVKVQSLPTHTHTHTHTHKRTRTCMHAYAHIRTYYNMMTILIYSLTLPSYVHLRTILLYNNYIQFY